MISAPEPQVYPSDVLKMGGCVIAKTSLPPHGKVVGPPQGAWCLCSTCGGDPPFSTYQAASIWDSDVTNLADRLRCDRGDCDLASRRRSNVGRRPSSTHSQALRVLLVACLWLVAACERPATAPSTPKSRQSQICLRVFPVGLKVSPSELTTDDTPRTLALSSKLVQSVIVLGKDYVRYTVAMCRGTSPFIGSVHRSTGVAELDHFLNSHVPELGLNLPSSGCQLVTLSLKGFFRACEAEKFF